LLQALHVLQVLNVLQALSRRRYLGKHIRIITSELGLQRRRRTKCTLLRILRSRSRSLRWRRNHTSCILLLRRQRSHSWRSHALRLCQSLDRRNLVEQRRCGTRRLSLLYRSWRRLRSCLRLWSRCGRCWLRDQFWLKGRHIQ
jgi:hypothetical protein